MTSLKTTTFTVLALLTAACSAPLPPRTPPGAPLTPPDSDVNSVMSAAKMAGSARRVHRLERQVAVALALYLDGGEAEDSEEGRAAFRAVCKVKRDEREIELDGLRVHAQIHAYAWRQWYHDHCTAEHAEHTGGRDKGLKTNALGTVVLDPETGQKSESGEVCDADAGTPPGRTYQKTPSEQLAQEQRDACEDAQ